MLFCTCLKHHPVRYMLFCPAPAAELAHGQRNQPLRSPLWQHPTSCRALASLIFRVSTVLTCFLGTWRSPFSREAHLFYTDVSSCYYLKTCLFVPHKATICSFFCFCCLMCWCRVCGSYTAGRSETFLGTVTVFSVSLKGSACASLLFRIFIEVHVLQISWPHCHVAYNHLISNAVGRGLEVLKLCGMVRKSAFCPSFTLALYLCSGNDSALCSAIFWSNLLFYLISAPWCFFFF